MKKNLTALIISALILYGGYFSQVHAQYDALNPEMSDGVDAETVCISGVACTATTCSTYSVSPVVPVHRFDVQFGRSVRASKIILEECLRIAGVGQVCIPAPLYDNNNILNYIKDGNTKISWNQDLTPYINGYMDSCKAIRSDDADCKADDIRKRLEGPEFQRLRDDNYTFLGIYKANGTTGLDPLTTFPATVDRNERFEWAAESALPGFQRSYRATAFYNPVAGSTGNEGSNQVATVGFFGGDDASCPAVTTTSADPYGKVSDKDTLEPVEGVKVVLYKLMNEGQPTESYEYVDMTRDNWKSYYGIDYAFFKNPYTTGALGDFSFIVPYPNKYKLLAMNPSYTPPATLDTEPLATLFNSSQYVMYTKASEKGKQVVTTQGVLYPNAKPHELNDRQVYQVVENGTTVTIPVIDFVRTEQERDIVSTGVSAKPAKVIFVKDMEDALGNWVFDGQINKPFGSVTAEKPDGTAAGSVTADAEGRFLLVVPKAEVVNVKELTIVPAATPLQQLVSKLPAEWLQKLALKVISIFEKDVYAQTSGETVTFQRRPRFIQGYAYGANGTVLKNATANVYDSTGVVPVYVTTTNEEGLFTMLSENIPSGSYTLEYVAQEGAQPAEVKPQDFVKQNTTYLEENELDLNTPRYSEYVNEQIAKSPPVVSTEGIAQISLAPPSRPVVEEVQPTTTATTPVEVTKTVQPVSTQLLILVALLLLLIVGAGLLVVYYMKKKQEPQVYE